MKVSGAVFVAFLTVVPLSAQFFPACGFGNVVFPAGRAPAAVNPWGNVVTPAIPQGAAALATGQAAARYGVGATGRSYYNGLGSGRRRGGTGSIYAYPVFVGGYGYGYAPPDQPAPNGANSAPGDQPAAAPPVVINQYFGTPPPAQGAPSDQANSNFHYYQAPANDNAAPPDTTYYLIAFKDHTVYSAVAYYTEGDTLHYFTEGNVHNQVSLSLVDRQLTEQLNREHNVEVRLP